MRRDHERIILKGTASVARVVIEYCAFCARDELRKIELLRFDIHPDSP